MKMLFVVGGVVAIAALIAVAVFMNEVSGPRPGRGVASADLPPVPRAIEAGRDFERNAKIRMAQNASAEIIGDDVHFHIGAFEILDGGARRDVCDHFSLLEITVRAEGVAVNGEPVEKKFSRPCEHALASETMAPVIVSIAELKKFADEEAGFWPEEWYVSEVRLSDAQIGRAIDVDGYEINFVLGRPLGVSF